METMVDTERTALDTLTLRIAQLREEVHWLAKELDALFVWERSCPMCGGGLRRESVIEVTRCVCGWTWE